MTLTSNPTAHTQTAIADAEVLAMAAAVGAVALEHDAAHDRDATFVTEAYDAMHDSGYLALAVPAELGGRGASLRQMTLAQEELGCWSGAAALSSTMHHYLTFVQCWRYRRGASDAAAVLGRIAHDRLVMATSGGSDWVCPSTVATEVDGGYLFNGRKGFCSQAPVATVLSTSAVLGETGPGAEVLHAGVPLAGPGVRLVETWDTLGMRGTASHDLVFEDVFVPADKVLGRRQYGRLEGPLLAAVVHFAPLAGAAYLGVARGAYDEARRVVGRQAVSKPGVLRQVGEMTARLRAARWALLGALAETGEDLALDQPTLETLMLAKREAVTAARVVADLALEVAGGPAFYRTSRLERAYRDVRGGPFHPLTPEATLDELGRTALGSLGVR
ncbi:acyl-CoA dehydrogenase family protein [Nocardioides sp. GXZ039]|uniref:acyl-CoA dehydrogenase family protein n=1 Tax=Nocardioides sp. GXZ039 TaxID=3136018 RepID=UPI0030F47699